MKRIVGIIASVLVTLGLVYALSIAYPSERVIELDPYTKIVERNGKRTLVFTAYATVDKYPPEDPFEPGITGLFVVPGDPSAGIVSFSGVNATVLTTQFTWGASIDNIPSFFSARATFRVTGIPVRVNLIRGGVAMTTGNLTNVAMNETYTWVINITAVHVNTSTGYFRIFPIARAMYDDSVLFRARYGASCSYNGTSQDVPATGGAVYHNSTHAEWWVTFDIPTQFINVAPVTCRVEYTGSYYLDWRSGWGIFRFAFVQFYQPLNVGSVELRVFYVAPASVSVG